MSNPHPRIYAHFARLEDYLNYADYSKVLFGNRALLPRQLLATVEVVAGVAMWFFGTLLSFIPDIQDDMSCYAETGKTLTYHGVANAFRVSFIKSHPLTYALFYDGVAKLRYMYPGELPAKRHFWKDIQVRPLILGEAQ